MSVSVTAAHAAAKKGVQGRDVQTDISQETGRSRGQHEAGQG
jgi:hypothetical protein